MPEPSYSWTIRVVACVLLFGAVQVPLAMRNLFKIKRNPQQLGHQKKYWYMFLAGNLPVTLYFARNARLEMRENRRLEQEYLRDLSRQDSQDMYGIEATVLSMEREPVRRRRVAQPPAAAIQR